MNSATLELFESVRAVLNGRDMSDAQWRDLAMRVHETGTAFRRRLDRAIRYARQGLRLEAVSEAEAEPSIFELAQLLDSEDAHKWRQLCARNKWPAPEVPDATALSEVEEAISQLRSLRGPLARMRLLVLSDAGPWERMQVLRELAHRDPHNAVWQEDLRALEPVCVQWLAAQAEAAIRAGDLSYASECVANLELTEWDSATAERHTAEVRAHLDSAGVAACAVDAARVVVDLEAEWAAENLPGVLARLEDMHALDARAGSHGGVLPPAIQARMGAVSAWAAARREGLDARREHEACAARLQAVLDTESPSLAELRNALNASENTAEGCPEDLRRRARGEIARLEQRSALRRTVTAAAAVVCVAGIVAAIWWGVAYTAWSNRIESLAAAVRAAVSTGNLDQAGQFLADAQQDIAASSDERMIGARREYMAARAAIARGDREFDAAMTDAGDPDAPDATRANIARAESLARTDAQHAAVSEWVRMQKRAEGARAAARTQDLLREARAIAQAAAAVRPDAGDPETTAQLAALDARLAAVARSAAGQQTVLSEVRGAQALLAAHRSTLDAHAAQQQRTDDQRAIASAATDPLALRMALEAFAARHPGTPEAIAFTEAMQAAPLWESVTAWNALARSAPIATAATATQAERDDMASALRAYALSNAASPYAQPARALAAMLTPVQGWRVWLEDKLAQYPPFSYYSVELRDGARYYLLQDPTRVVTQSPASGPPGAGDGGAYRIYSVLTESGVDPRPAFQRIDVSAIKSQGPSPQRVLARDLRDLLADEGDTPATANDVQTSLTVLARVRDATTVDGAFAAQVVQRLLEAIEPEVPPGLRGDIQAAAKRLAREKPDEAEWVAPSAAGRARSRELAVLLRETLKIEQWRKAYADTIAAAAAPLRMQYTPAGVLLGSLGDGAPRRIAGPDRQPLQPGTELFALRVGIGNTPTAMVQVGTVGADHAVAFTDNAATFPAGTMVFRRGGGG